MSRISIAATFLVLLFSHQARAGVPWSADTRATLPDALAVELVLAREGVRPGDASVVVGQTAENAGSENPQRRSFLSWLRFSGAPLLSPQLSRENRALCAEVQREQTVHGGRKLIVYGGRIWEHDAALAEHSRAGLILAEGEQPVAIVNLRPGDLIQTTERIHRRTGAVTEHIELVRGAHVLTLLRSDQKSTACFTPPAGAPFASR